ncbi:MAG TPA: nucleotide pyrophosphohydrolase [Lysobacter sp.]|nr:nucleotide pyrophosphohydrolase [Lysobacter sp.]
MNLTDIRDELRAFARERDWEKFHSPKNLAMALTVETAELLEIFQWMSEEQSRTLDEARRGAVESELADVLLYLIQLADRLDIDLLAVAERKMVSNAERYPAERARGRSDKYDRL